MVPYTYICPKQFIFFCYAALPQDCSDILHEYSETTSGRYMIYPIQGRAVEVRCDMDTDGGGWTVSENKPPYCTHNVILMPENNLPSVVLSNEMLQN